MKHSGCYFEYTKERDEDMRRAYSLIVGECDRVDLRDVFHRLVNMPSKRFWVTPDRAAIVIHSMMRGDTLQNMRPMKREMFQELYRIVMELKEKYPTASMPELCSMAVLSPAPKFYLTVGSAIVIWHKAKKNRRKSRIQH
jgi:hypothetical protein